MNRKQGIVWGLAALVWLVFMGPRLLVLRHGDQSTQEHALLTLVVFSVILLAVAAGVARFLRDPPARRSQPRPKPAADRASDEDPEQTRATDLLGPGAAARRAARATAERRRRSAG